MVGVDRLGDMSHVHVSLTDNQTGKKDIDPQTDNLPTDNLNIPPTTAGMLVARSAAGVTVEIGQTVGLAINPERILWFDAGNGKNISKDQT